jgi:hypothetical protein
MNRNRRGGVIPGDCRFLLALSEGAKWSDGRRNGGAKRIWESEIWVKSQFATPIELPPRLHISYIRWDICPEVNSRPLLPLNINN